jgi:hypothetical protein
MEATNTKSKHRHVFTGIPSFFRACCWQASEGRVPSITGWIRYGYRDAGYQLARHTVELEPYSAETEEWEAQIEELFDAVEAGDREGIWRWYVATYPLCMALVPRKRKQAFIDGVLLAEEEGDLR